MKTKQKQNRVSIEEYIETYCQEKRIRERYAVYVNPETHRKLGTVARIFANKYHTTASSLADSIISRHFEEHRELLNNAHEEREREVFAWLNDNLPNRSEEPDSQSDDAGITNR